MAILIMIFTGVRPGEFVESSNYKGSNEGILYKDLTVIIGFDDDGSRVYGCMVRIRNRKWARGVEKQAYTMVLRNDNTEPSLCPLRQLLASAIGDRALQDVDCVEDLFNKYRPPPGQPFSRVPIRPEMREVPLLRQIFGGQVDDTKIWKYMDVRYLLKGLGERAGYQSRLSPYNFRRGFGSVLDRFASAVQRRKHMGHKSDDTFLSYLSDVSGLNMQDLVNGRDPDHQLVESLQSMASSYQNTGSSLGKDESYTSFRAGVVRPPPSRAIRVLLQHDSNRAAVVKELYEPDESPDFERAVHVLTKLACEGRLVGRMYADVPEIRKEEPLCPYETSWSHRTSYHPEQAQAGHEGH